MREENYNRGPYYNDKVIVVVMVIIIGDDT